jgi:hypothetical protein
MGISADKAVRRDAVGPASGSWSELPVFVADQVIGPQTALPLGAHAAKHLPAAG